MPWIHATVSRAGDAVVLADALAAEVAGAAALEPSDVVVLVTVATACAAQGGLVLVAGRQRLEPVERVVAEAVRRVVADAVGVPEDLVVVVRC